MTRQALPTRDATPAEKQLWLTMIIFTQPAYNRLAPRSAEFRELNKTRNDWEAALGFAPAQYGKDLQVYVGRTPLETAQ